MSAFITLVIIFLFSIVLFYFFHHKSSSKHIKRSLNKRTFKQSDKQRDTSPNDHGKVFTQNELKSIISPRKYQELSKYSLPSSFSILDNYALRFCTNLTELNIHEKVFFLEDKSFIYCDNLININVHEDNKYYCSKLGVLFSKDTKELIYYPSCKQSSTYFIPQGVEVIHSHAFTSNKYLKYVIIPNSVTHINENAFVNCKLLKQIVIPETVIDIHSRSFSICPRLSLRGYENSICEDYCNKYYIPFESLEKNKSMN